MKKTLIIKAAAVAAALCAAGAASAELKQFEVNGDKVTVAEQKLVYDALVEQGRPAGIQTENLARSIVTERKVLAAEAEDQRLDREDKVKLQTAAAEENVLRNALVAKWRGEAKVTDKEVRDRYDAEKRAYGDTEFHVAHIFVKTQKEADDLLKKLDKNPKDFEKLAREKSLNKTTAAQGGDLGWIVPAQVDRSFSSAFIYLKPGSVAQVAVQAGGGWNVVKLVDKRKAQNFPTFEARKDAIKSLLTEQKVAARIGEVLKKAQVEE